MLIRPHPDILPSEITPRAVFEKRRAFIRTLAAGSMAGGVLSAWAARTALAATTMRGVRLPANPNPAYRLSEELTSYQNATEYNNFYEFGTRKIDPSGYAHKMKTRPWTVSVEGLVAKPKIFDIEQLLKLAPMEERIYRLRCVEGWSMVIPWIGYPLAELIRQVEPLGSAKFVEFVTLADAAQMRGLDDPVLNWPYREGLRMDEARHPLTLLTFGLYGEMLPNQNGAPVRITVPWKYGFKSAKSIVKIRFTDRMPLTSWNESAPQEYGFYSNVNPKKDHPRWSQATERRIGKGEDGFAALFTPRIKTLMFNGYETQVGQLYAGMDLNRFY